MAEEYAGTVKFKDAKPFQVHFMDIKLGHVIKTPEIPDDGEFHDVFVDMDLQEVQVRPADISALKIYR